MNPTFNTSSLAFIDNSSTTNFESWFIPIDILMIICTALVMGLVTLFLFIMILDKTCHTVPMMLIANVCLAKFIFSIDLLSAAIFSIENDYKRIEYQDSFCIFRCYMGYVAYAVMNYSYLLQSIYRYVIVIYPTRLFWQSRKFQILLICITWIVSFLCPGVFTSFHQITYNVDNQICLIPLGLSFPIIYMTCYADVIPILMITFIYLTLIRYVHRISKRVTPINTLFRAQRELKMIRRTVILVMILSTLGFPNALFIFMSFFNSEPRYYQRISCIVVDVLLVFVTIALFKFADPLKTSLMKRIKVRPNIVVAIVR